MTSDNDALTPDCPWPGIRTVGAIPPEAEVERTGRWMWRITIKDGLLEYGPAMSGVILGWHRLGRHRAEQKAARELSKYLNRRAPESFRVQKKDRTSA